MQKFYIGKIVKPQGVRGEVKIQPLTDDITRFKKLKTVFSKEIPLVPNSTVALSDYDKNQNRSIPGSVSFVPSVAGLIIAGEVIKDLIGDINVQNT